MNLILQEIILPAGTEWRTPNTAWWFVCIAEGAAYWLGKPSAVALDPNSVVVIPGMGDGCIRSSQLSQTRLSYFGFLPDTIVGVFTISDRHHVALPSSTQDSHARFFKPNDPIALDFAAIRSTRIINSSMVFRCNLLGFAIRVLNGLESRELPTDTDTTKTTTARRLSILVKKLSDTDLIRFTGDQLASHCGCSVRHFRRLFRHVMGVSLQQKQSELRMLKAKQLLLETDLSIVEVALACGFHHQSLFHSMFKEWFNSTPGQWRSKNRPNLLPTDTLSEALNTSLVANGANVPKD